VRFFTSALPIRADARDGLQLFRRRAEDARQAAEPRQQRLGDRLDVAARQAARQQQFQHLIVG
jgi:hypothetical protein